MSLVIKFPGHQVGAAFLLLFISLVSWIVIDQPGMRNELVKTVSWQQLTLLQ